MPRITFQPDGQTLVVPQGARLLGAIRRAGRPIGYSCRGAGICLACKVWVHGPCAPPSPEEARLLGRITTPGPWRIACLARVVGDVTVGVDYWGSPPPDGWK